MKTVAVLGGGIAGLSAAYELQCAAAAGAPVRPVLLEAGSGLGGKLGTLREDGYCIERAAQGWLRSARKATELALRLGLEGELVAANPGAATRYIYRQGKLHGFGQNPVGILTGGLLSTGAKLRLVAEPFARGLPNGVEESVEEFAARRIGPEAARLLISAAVTGIYAGDSRQLSLKSVFPKMHEMETQHGSLVRAALALLARGRQDPPPGPKGFLLCYRTGMARWASALGEKLGDRVHPDSRVRAIAPGGNGSWRVELDSQSLHADAVILATDTAATARLLEPLEATAAEALRGIPAANVAVVALAFPGGSFGRDSDGYGFLVPRGEDLRILGALWETNVFPGRAPEGQALLRVMVGGTRAPELVDQPDGALVKLACEDLDRAVGLKAEPLRSWIVRWKPAIPQYTLGHGGRVATVEAALARRPGLFAAGNSYRGVAVGGCIEDGERAARAALEHLGAEPV